jgi:oligosaccharide repeat unit polymerase
MRTAFYWLITVTAALSLAFMSVLGNSNSIDLALWIVALALSSPLLLALGKRAWIWVSKQDLFSPLVAYPLTYIAWFAIGSIDFVQLPSSISFSPFDPIPRRVLFYAGIGLLGYLCGARSLMGASKGWRPERISEIRFSWQPTSSRFVLLILLLIAAGSYLYVLLQTGVVALRSDAGEFVYELDKYHLIMQAFFMSAYTAFLLIAAVVFDPVRGGAKALTGAVAVLLMLMLSFLGLGSRSAFVPPVLSGVVLYHYIRKPIRLRTAIAIVLVLFAFLSVYGYVRALTFGDSTPLEAAGVPAVAQPFLYCYLYFRYTVATFRDVTDIIPGQVPFQHGSITFMPLQSLLPGHHYMSDIYFKNLLGNDFIGAGQPATVLGPFYADFGVAGIFAGMFAWGIIVTKLYKWMLRDRTVFSTMIYAWATQAGLFGMFGGMFVFLGTLVIPLGWVVLDVFVRRSHRLRIAGANAGV